MKTLQEKSAKIAAWVMALMFATCAFSQDAFPPEGAPFEGGRPPMPPEFQNMTDEQRQAKMQEFMQKRQEFEAKMQSGIENALNTPSSAKKTAASPEQNSSAVAEAQPQAKVGAFVSTARLSSNDTPKSLIAALIFNNPFGNGAANSASTEDTLGIYLKSIAMIDGQWQFSMISKDGRGAWLKIGEENPALNCKVVSFDENSMTAKTFVGGRTYDMSISERSSRAGTAKVELLDELKPRKRISPDERIKMWTEYASDDQKQAANQIYQAAKAAGRRLNRDDFRKLHDIERNIKIPEAPSANGGPARGGQ